MIPKPLERDIQKTCLAILRARGVFAWRANTGAFAGAHKGKRRFARFGIKGQSDILGVLPDGRFLAVEIKRPGEQPTIRQIGFIRAVNGKGGVAFWTDDADYLDIVLSHVLVGARVQVNEDGGVVIHTLRGVQ